MEHQNEKCPICTSDNLRSFVRQIRATDQNPSKYHKCLDCQYGWKESNKGPNV